MTAIVIIAALAGLVWLGVYAFRGSPLAGCLAFVVVGAVFGHPFFHFELGPIPLTIDRLLLVVALGAYVIQRSMGRTDPKPPARADWLLAAFLALVVVSGSLVGWASNPAEPWSTVYRVLGGYLLPVAVYWMARQSPLDRRDLSMVHGTLTILGAYLAVTGLLEISGQWWAVFPPHIADSSVGIHFGRARGPMVQAVSYGLYVGVCLLAAWAYRWRFGPRGRLVLLALLPLMAAGLFFSYTRSVWIGIGLAAAVVLGVTLRGRVRAAVLGAMAAGALLLALGSMESLVNIQRDQVAADSRKSVSMRGSFAYVSWKMFLDRPLFGFGFGQFPMAKMDYLDDRSTELVLEHIRPFCHHNTFLSVLTELGLVGLLLFVAILVSWARAAWALARAVDSPPWTQAQGALMLGVLAIYACQAMFHELTYTPIDNSLVFLLAGITAGLRPAATGRAAGQWSSTGVFAARRWLGWQGGGRSRA